MMRGEWYRLRDDLVLQCGSRPTILIAAKGEILRCCSELNRNGFAGYLWIAKRGTGFPVRERDVDHVPKPTNERKAKR